MKNTHARVMVLVHETSSQCAYKCMNRWYVIIKTLQTTQSQARPLSMTFKINIHNVFYLFIYTVLKKVLLFLRNWGMDTVYSVASMALYLVFFSCLATIVMATWKIFDMVI